MKKVVFTVKDDVCARNNKDPNATELFSVMNHYGTVESFDTVMARATAEQNAIINGLNQKIAVMEDNSVTELELPALKALRDVVATSVNVVKDENVKLRDDLRKADEKAKNLSIGIGEMLAAYNND
jgi:hypothetical protein